MMSALEFQAHKRRTLLHTSACGFGYLALRSLCQQNLIAADPSNRPLNLPHKTTRAKRVIFLFMHGGPSQVDTFDYKPEL